MSFWGYSFLLHRFARIRSWFVPVICMSGTGLILYLGALSDILPQTADLILAGGLAGTACFLVFLLCGKICIPRPGLIHLCFCIGAAVFAGLSLTMKLTHYDNFSHWAVIVKYLLSADRLPGADTAIVASRDYPPGSSLLIYYVCRYAGHSQGIMLLAQNSLILACFYAVFGIVKERRRFLLYSFLGMGCAMLSYLNLTIRINNLLVDFLLPLMALASAAVSYRLREGPLKLCLLQAVLLGYTGIIKNRAFLRGRGGDLCICRNGTRSDAACAEAMPAGAADPLWQRGPVSWHPAAVCCMADSSGYGSGGLRADGDPGRAGAVRPGGGAFSQDATDVSDRAFQAVFLCTALSVSAIIYGRIRLGKWWRLTWILPAVILVTAGYYAGMLYMYLYSMPAEEALRLAGFERYACSAAVLYAGFLLMGAVVDMEHSFAVGIDERGPAGPIPHRARSGGISTPCW